MRGGINRLQPLDRDMGIHLGGLEVLVPEQLLDSPQISPVFEEVGSETVTQFVRSQRRIQSGQSQVSLQATLDSHRAECYPTAPLKHGIRRLLTLIRRAPVGLQRFQGGFTHRNHSFLAPLADHLKRPSDQVHLFVAQRTNLADPEA